LKTRHSGAIGVAERMERWVAKRAARIVVPSRYLASVVERWGAPSKRIHVVYAGIEPLPAPSAPREALRMAFGIEGAKTVVLAVMRAVPWKNGDLLIRAISNAPPDRLLVLAGDGPALAEWKALAASLGIADRVRFLGRVGRTAIADWYRAADVLALPSSYEGFPHVVYEAVSSGLPCLVSDRAGNPETKALFPEHVDVLPIDDAAPWAEAFSRAWPRRPAAAPPVFAEKAKEILEILSTCAS
jgi:glycosyltransferase involved in cell wall biosynthesis